MQTKGAGKQTGFCATNHCKSLEIIRNHYFRLKTLKMTENSLEKLEMIRNG